VRRNRYLRRSLRWWQFDMVPIVDLIEQERVRAEYCSEQADRKPDAGGRFPFPLDTAAFWHNRTASRAEGTAGEAGGSGSLSSAAEWVRQTNGRGY
jgi:hypothetical protein